MNPLRNQEIDDFARSMKEWAHNRAFTPPREASRSVLERLSQRRSSFRNPATGLAAATVLIAGALLLWNVVSPSAPRLPVPGESTALVVDDDVVLLWLDSETPLYLSLTSEGDQP